MDALGRVLTAGAVRTRDLGGTASTFEFADAVCKDDRSSVTMRHESAGML